MARDTEDDQPHLPNNVSGTAVVPPAFIERHVPTSPIVNAIV
jgi:hypothetical protein